MRTSACFWSSLSDRSARINRLRSGVPSGRLEDAGLHVEGLGRDAQRLGDLLEDLGRGPSQSPLDLAQVRIGDPGQLGQPPERQAGRAPLLTDEGAQISPAILGVGASLSSVVPRRVSPGLPARGGVRIDVASGIVTAMQRRPTRGETTDMADYTLPDLPYDYGALEPHVSGQIMELHHDKHHAAYVTGANQHPREAGRGPGQGRLRSPSSGWRRPWPSTSRATCCTRSSGRT